MSDWWVATSGSDLEQGDILHNLEVHRIVVAPPARGPERKVRVETGQITGIIVTQTCDLENAKTTEVLVARVVAWKDFAAAQYRAGNTAVAGSAYIENLRRGNIPPITLLAARTSRPPLPWSIVDFRELTTLPRAEIDRHIQRPGSKQRLRLQPPYKEHFAQAFARYFMRVGLPHDAHEFAAAAKDETSHLRNG